MTAFRCTTPAGEAVLTVERIETDAVVDHTNTAPVLLIDTPSPIHGTAIIVRSHTEGLDDVFGVFTRDDHGFTRDDHGRTGGWRQATGELTAAEAAEWQQHRAGLAFPTPRLAAWLSAEASAAGIRGWPNAVRRPGTAGVTT